MLWIKDRYIYGPYCSSLDRDQVCEFHCCPQFTVWNGLGFLFYAATQTDMLQEDTCTPTALSTGVENAGSAKPLNSMWTAHPCHQLLYLSDSLHLKTHSLLR